MTEYNPEVIEVRDSGARKRWTGYASPVVLFLLSSVLAVPLVILYFLDHGFSAQVDTAQVTKELLVPALVITFLSEILVIVGCVFFTRDRARWRQLIGFENFSWKKLAFGPVIGLLFFLGLLGLQAAASAAGVDVGNSDTSDQFASLSGFARLFVLFICVPVLAPILEEIFFRGIVLGNLLEGHGPGENRWATRTGVVIWSAVYSSLCFSLFHLQGISSTIDFVVLGWTFLFACASCTMRIKFRSLYPSMAAHGFYNFLSAVSLFLG